jgi:hypothetical protein
MANKGNRQEGKIDPVAIRGILTRLGIFCLTVNREARLDSLTSTKLICLQFTVIASTGIRIDSKKIIIVVCQTARQDIMTLKKPRSVGVMMLQFAFSTSLKIGLRFGHENCFMSKMRTHYLTFNNKEERDQQLVWQLV